MTNKQKTVRGFLTTLMFIFGGLSIVVVGTLGERWQHERAAVEQAQK